MSNFTTPLQVEELEDGWFKLISPFEFYLEFKGGERVIVPEGFKTNFASVPSWLQWLFPPYHADYGKAFVLHDYLVGEGEDQEAGHIVLPILGNHVRTVTKDETRDITRKALKVLKCPAWKRSIMLAGIKCYDYYKLKIKPLFTSN